MQRKFGSYMIFGGAGLVGMATCRRLARDLRPERVVVCSLQRAEAEDAVATLRTEYGDVDWVPGWGNLFVPTEFAELSRSELLADHDKRRQLVEAVFGDFERGYLRNHLAVLVKRHRPDAIVDCVNTATGISYQDSWANAATLRDDVLGMLEGAAPVDAPSFVRELESGLLAQGIPQIVFHVRVLYRACSDAGVSAYVKIGTTGTGGMGLNIPYTHSEDRPSRTLLAKNAIAFSQTGLLFLLARTPGGPVVKEIKPGAMIGYRAVEVRQIPGPGGKPKPLFRPRTVDASSLVELHTREDAGGYEPTGDVLELTVVNTGENGLFAKGEFAAITALGQMEFVTPEEIARAVVLELTGGSSGFDIISALDSAVMEPSYRAGLLRHVALKDLSRIEDDHGKPSVALGDLGPPELSKLLFESWLLLDAYGEEFDRVLKDDAGSPRDPNAVAALLSARMGESPVASQAISIGIPILLADGRRFLRGPLVKVPEIKGKRQTARIRSPDDIDKWARRGWIDLRPANMKVWLDRLSRMAEARQELARKGSAAVSRQTYLPVNLKIGDVVAWIFNNEMSGYRIK